MGRKSARALHYPESDSRLKVETVQEVLQGTH